MFMNGPLISSAGDSIEALFMPNNTFSVHSVFHIFNLRKSLPFVSYNVHSCIRLRSLFHLPYFHFPYVR